jgi:SulP family sulfate permease
MKFLKPFVEFASPSPDLRNYSRSKAFADMVAGLSVGVMLVPQAMAYAVLGDLPPIFGLYASLIPLVVYAFIGGSRQMAFGIVAIDMLVLVSGLQRVVPPDDPKYIQYAFTLALMAGGIQLAMAAVRLGFIVNFLSRPVVIGFTTAAPILIALSQLDMIMGVTVERTTAAHMTVYELATNAGETHLLTLGVGVAAILAILGFRKINDKIPGPLIVVVVATLAAWWFDLASYGVAEIGPFEASLPEPILPFVPFEVMRDLLPTALTLALVQFMAHISIAKSFAAREGYEVDANRELRALGFANSIGSFFQSPPVSASFSRSSIGFDAGVATGVSNLFAAITVLVAILFLSPAFQYIPMPILGAIIMVSALFMVVPRDIHILFTVKRADGFVAIFTIITTLVIGIQEGVLMGVGAAGALILYRIARPPIVELGRSKEFERWKAHGLGEPADTQRHEGILVLRIDSALTFVNAEYVKERVIRRAIVERSVEAVILDFRSVNDIDATAVSTLEMMVDALSARDTVLYISNLKEEPQAILEAADFLDRLPENGTFATTEEAVQYARDQAKGSTEIIEE